MRRADSGRLAVGRRGDSGDARDDAATNSSFRRDRGRPARHDRRERPGTPRQPPSDEGPCVSTGGARRVWFAWPASRARADDRGTDASSRSNTSDARTTTWSATSGWPPFRTGTRPSSTGSLPNTWKSSCRSSIRRPSDGRASPSATSCAARAGSGSRRRTATGSPSSCATVRSTTCGSSSSPTTSGSSASGTRVRAAWASPSASSPCTPRHAAFIPP